MAAESSLEVRDDLVDSLRVDLVGPIREDEVLRQAPSRWYLTGFLVPKGAPEEQRVDPTADEEVAAGDADGSADDDTADASPKHHRSYFPSSIGVTVFVPAEATHIRLAARWGEYRVLPPDEAEAFRQAVAQANADEAGDMAEAVLGDKAGGAKGDDDRADHEFRRTPTSVGTSRSSLWQRTQRNTSVLEVPLVDKQHRVEGGDDLWYVVRVRPAPKTGGLPDGARVVSIFLVNDKEAVDDPRLADIRTLFQAELEVGCEVGFLKRTHQVDEALVAHKDAGEMRADLQYRDHGEWGVGHGVAISPLRESSDDGDSVRRVCTTWIPQAAVFRMASRTIPELSLSMDNLAEVASAQALSAQIEPMFSAYEGWIGGQALQLEGLAGSRHDEAEMLLEGARDAIGRMRSGLALLERDEAAFEAFRLCNRAMAMAARRVRPDVKDPSWHAFQLAFVLLNLAPVADPNDRYRRCVELLFFPTGGGKTEAYLGVAAFVMLLRRLRHAHDPDEGAGVAVVLRYTLRLLTLDQLGRAATLTCALELLRREQPEQLGHRRFTVGLWVGLSATANWLKYADRQVRAYKADPDNPTKAPPVPLMGCPWCQAPFTPDSYNMEGTSKKPSALRVACPEFACEFSYGNTDKGLPLVVIDEQLYRELPTFLIATVDKFAMLPWRGQAGMLFGKVRAKTAQGFWGHAEKPPKNAQLLHDGLRPPDLVIQDELHLITGPLGTMVGLYETAFEQLATGADGRVPKIIASTATARRAQSQIQALYARGHTEIFPPPGLDADDNFFAEEDRRPEQSRLYVGLAAPGRSMKALMVRVYSALLSATYRHWYNAAQAGLSGADNPADTYMSLVCYFNALKELGGARRLVAEEVAPRASKLESRQPLQEVGRRNARFKNRRLGFDILELTSRISTDNIRKAKGHLESPYDGKNKRNDVLLASSMISVGVDISRLGLMVMNGQPRTVAEYIQASSRVGRSTPGLVVTLHNVYRARDRSHYERFTAFHESFYRFVEAATVTPFSSRAIDRGLAGMTVALARHSYPQLTPAPSCELVDRVPHAAGEVARVVGERVNAHRRNVEGTARHVQERVHTLFSDWSGAVAALGAAAVHVHYSRMETRGGVRPLLRTAVDERDEDEPRLNRFVAPTSMRDVEPGVHVWVS